MRIFSLAAATGRPAGNRAASDPCRIQGWLPACVVLLALLFSGAIQAAEERLYRIDLLVFRQLNPADTERFGTGPGPVETGDSLRLERGLTSAAAGAYPLKALLSPAMVATERRIAGSRGYRNLWSGSWQMELGDGRPQRFRLEPDEPVDEDRTLAGVIEISLARYLHLNADLALAEWLSPQAVRAREEALRSACSRSEDTALRYFAEEDGTDDSGRDHQAGTILAPDTSAIEIPDAATCEQFRMQEARRVSGLEAASAESPASDPASSDGADRYENRDADDIPLYQGLGDRADPRGAPTAGIPGGSATGRTSSPLLPATPRSADWAPWGPSAEFLRQSSYRVDAVYRIQRKQRSRSGPLYYLDHPRFGVVFQFTRLGDSGPAPSEADTGTGNLLELPDDSDADTEFVD